MSSRTDILRGISWIGVGHAVAQACWFGSLLVLAAHVAPRAFGGVVIAMVGVQVAWLLVGSGTRAALVIAPVLTRAQVRRALALNLVTGCAIALAAALAPDALLVQIAPGADPMVVRALAVSIVLFAASIVPLALLQREMRFRAHAVSTAGAAALASVGSVVAVLAGAGVWALVARQIAFQALIACFAWICARRLAPAEAVGDAAVRPAAARSFFVLALVAFGALNVDSVVIAHAVGPQALGLYALAFTLAFAPMTQIAWQIGKVIFPAAARSEQAALERRATHAIRLSALAILPAVPLAVTLAPVLVHAALGERWQGMVLPLQILLVAGGAHALLAILREFLLGGGAVNRCLRIELVWLAVTAAALIPAVAAGGIVGAAILHVALVLPLGAAYARWGLPRIGIGGSTLVRALRPAGVTAAAESVAGALTLLAGRSAGLGATAAWSLAAAVCIAVIATSFVVQVRPRRIGLAALLSARSTGGVA